MPRFEFEQDQPVIGDWIDQSTRIMNLVVRAFGFVLLVVGLVVALMVVGSAWALYKNPENIESFARAVEHGSNLDLTLSNATAAGRHQLDANGESAADTAAVSSVGDTSPAFRFSYFVAWLLAILLLLLVGRLAIAAVRTGGELALYDVQVKKLARALIEERTRR